MSEYIKREDVLKSRISVLEHIHGIAHTMFVVTVQDINNVPAADVEPVVRGEWKEMRDPYGDLTGWIHEECGRETNFPSEYCSKCGAKMTFVERIGSGE